MADETTSQTGTEGQPSDGQQTGDTGSQSQGEAQESRSPTDIEAYWKNRQSQEASAAAAREKVLREEVENLKIQVAASQAKDSKTKDAQSSETDLLRQKVGALEQELQDTRQAAVRDTRKAKYPFAAADLDDNVIALMDEANLAALNVKLAPSGNSNFTIIDPSQAGRTPPTGATNKALRDKTTEELKADLKALGPDFVQQIRG